MPRQFTLLPFSFLLLISIAGRMSAQTDVYNNQDDFGFTAIGFGSPVTMWDDLQLTQGGLLSSISFIADPPDVLGQTASGVIDLRVFDETFNRPQGDPLGTIPFSGTFEFDPNDPFNRRLNIELNNLESLGINLPTVGRIGAGIRFDDDGWFFPDAGTPELGASPGGNWLNTSLFERSDVDGLGWRIAIADPMGVGPGVGTYNVFETALATPNHPTSNGGSGIDAGFFGGIGFRVERTTELQQVGAWIGGTGTIFAAIVDLGSNQYNLPNPSDLSGSDVIGTALIDLDGTGFTGQNVTTDLELTLEPGAYALVFGAGKFGADADADGLLRSNHIPNGDWTQFSIRQSDGLRFFQASNKRIFAIAKSAPGTLQVRPTFDVVAEVIRAEFSNDVESVRLIDGDSSITVNEATNIEDPNKVAVLEFSLGDVPTNRDLLAVTLELDVNFANTSPPTQFEVFGYAGDGAAGRQDAEGQQTVVGMTNIDSTGITTINIDPTFLESLVGNATHLGLTIVPGGSGAFGFGTLEGGEFREPPLLTINLGEAPLSGDYDLDGDVDGHDFLSWQRGDSPNSFSASDLTDWQANYGVGTSSSLMASSTTVPEPTGFALLFAAAFLQLQWPRTRQTGYSKPR